MNEWQVVADLLVLAMARSDLGATNLSASESSILSQAISRAKQLEQEEKEERMGEVFLSNCSFDLLD